MGIYINPPDKSKEQFLDEHATPITALEAANFDIDADRTTAILCHVDHYGQHTAVGVAYSNRERDHFLQDGTDRTKTWYKMPVIWLGPASGNPSEFPLKYADLDYWGIH